MQACQSRDWKLHKLECPALQEWSASAPSPDFAIPNDAVRCLARLLWRRKKSGVDSIWVRPSFLSRLMRSWCPTFNSPQVKQLDAMQSRKRNELASLNHTRVHSFHPVRSRILTDIFLRTPYASFTLPRPIPWPVFVRGARGFRFRLRPRTPGRNLPSSSPPTNILIF
jgi:hypothetical protein